MLLFPKRPKYISLSDNPKSAKYKHVVTKKLFGGYENEDKIHSDF